MAPGTTHHRFGPIRMCLAVAQLITAVGFFLVLGGLSNLQKTANGLSFTPALTALYTETFQSGQQIPYPTMPHTQFALIWYQLFVELLILAGILVLTFFPTTILRLKHALGFVLSYVAVLVTYTTHSLLAFHRTAAANLVYGSKTINVTLAGLLIVLVGNGITLLLLGIVGTGSDFVATHPHHADNVASGKHATDV